MKAILNLSVSSVAVLAQDTGVQLNPNKSCDFDLECRRSNQTTDAHTHTRSSQIHADWPTAMGKDGRQSTYGCADLHSTTTATTHHWTTRREGSRGGVAWRIQASTSQEREGPALALALAGGLVPGRARFGISRGVCWGSSACAAWGRLAGRSQPPSDGRSPPLPLPCRTAPHLLRLQIFTATSTHLYFLSNTAGRSWFSRTRAGVADLGE